MRISKIRVNLSRVNFCNFRNINLSGGLISATFISITINNRILAPVQAHFTPRK